MYQLNKPIRIVKRDENIMMVSIPKVELQIEVNDNVADFFSFLSKETQFKEDIVEKFAEKNNITNVEDYKEIFNKMKELEVLIEV